MSTIKVSIVPSTGAISVECENAKDFAIALERIQTLAAASKDLFGDKASQVIKSSVPRVAGNGQVRSGTTRDCIITMLRDAQAPLTCKDIAASLGAAIGPINSACWNLNNEGKIVKVAPNTFALEEYQDNAVSIPAKLAGQTAAIDEVDIDFIPEDDENETTNE